MKTLQVCLSSLPIFRTSRSSIFRTKQKTYKVIKTLQVCLSRLPIFRTSELPISQTKQKDLQGYENPAGLSFQSSDLPNSRTSDLKT